MISIEDKGIGISEEAGENLFQPLKQVQRLAGDTGLGLYSLSNRIQALMGSRGLRFREDDKQVGYFGSRSLIDLIIRIACIALVTPLTHLPL